MEWKSRYDDIKAILGDKSFQAIQDAKVLVVGAGGIGCELLKNLVMSGFQDIVVIDLDTIDVSNLNRQFLFRRAHVGLSKAQVARETVLKFNPHVKIVAAHTKLQDPMFSAEYMRQFHIVLSALDNIEARRYLNRLCFSVSVPLIESGTQGYLGQCTPILHGYTPCFECHPLGTQPTFAVCTIRNTPDKPVHCVAWGKLLYTRLFGPQDDENSLADLAIKPFTPATTSATTTASGFPSIAALEYAVSVFEACFFTEIEAQRQVASRWIARNPPSVIHAKDVIPTARAELPHDHPLITVLEALPLPMNDDESKKEASSASSSSSSPEAVLRRLPGTRISQRQTAQSHMYYALHFILSIARVCDERTSELGELSFDKDDEHAMDVVATASNLRMHAYEIPMPSEFDVKGIAGNIVHAIATTNAIAAGLIVVEATKVLTASSISEAARIVRNSWIRQVAPLVVAPTTPEAPSEGCFCSKPVASVRADMTRASLLGLFRAVQKTLGVDEVMFDVLTDSGKYLGLQDDYPEVDSDDDDDDDEKENDRNDDGKAGDAAAGASTSTKKRSLLAQPLCTPAIGLRDGAVVTAKDSESDASVTLRITHSPGMGRRVEVDVDRSLVEKERARAARQAQAERERRQEEEEMKAVAARKRKAAFTEAIHLVDDDDTVAVVEEGASTSTSAATNGTTAPLNENKPMTNSNNDNDVIDL